MKSLGISMIVRDAEKLLPACLASVREFANEICIADTGSSDDTVAVANRCGARVISIPWTNDFAAARNLALAQMHSEWILSLDADEQLDSHAAMQIPPLMETESFAGYQVTIRNYVLSLNDRVWDHAAKPNDSLLPAAKSYPAFVEHENVRLFRREPAIRFVGRVHESVGSTILESGRKLGAATFLIHHFGLAADEETRARKNRFYRELGREKIREMPKNAQAHLELGLVEMDNFANLEEARKLFARAGELNPQFGLACFFQGVALLKLERAAEALRALDEAERLGHRTGLVAEFRGDACYNQGHFPRAADCYETALRRDPANPSLESKLGLAVVRAGNRTRGIHRLQRAVATQPGTSELHDRLITTLVWLGRLDDAATAAETKLQAIEKPTANDFLRAASLWAKTKDWTRAIAWLEEGLAKYPTSNELKRGMDEALLVAAAPRMASTLK
jgi:Tfp pilus assembly protein PilF